MSIKSELKFICPRCHAGIGTGAAVAAQCPVCGLGFPRYYGIPVLREVGAQEALDFLAPAACLPAMNSAKLDIDIAFVREALASGRCVLEIGAGTDVCTRPNLVKTDAFIYAKDLDYVIDTHAMPFADNSFSHVYALAVFEHLHSPWIAAEEIFRILQPGGRVFVLTAFNQHLHGFPHHYFNMTEEGLRRIFKSFTDIQTAPSPCSSLEQVAYSLEDVLGMANNLETSYRAASVGTIEDREALRKLAEMALLREALMYVTRLLPGFSAELLSLPQNLPFWRRIAPGIELTAMKPG